MNGQFEIYTLLFALVCLPCAAEPYIDIWYGEHQRFGHLGHPQRWVNVLGNVSPASEIASLTWSLNGSKPRPLSFGEDQRRLARPGDFNVEIDRSELQLGRNTVTVTVIDRSGRVTQRTSEVEYLSQEQRWPLPYIIDWSKVERIDEVAQVVDGKWTLTPNGVRTVERYYDRVLAFGDDSWRDYEVSTTVTFHAFTPPLTPPNNTRVTHAAIALRWPGHDRDEHQPHVKWYPLGATAEFMLTTDLKQCRWRIFDRNPYDSKRPFFWRIFDDNKRFYVESKRHQAIELDKPYGMKHRVETLNEGRSRYRVKLWPVNESEPTTWDLERIEAGDCVFCSKVATDSTAKLPPIPDESGH